MSTHKSDKLSRELHGQPALNSTLTINLDEFMSQQMSIDWWKFEVYIVKGLQSIANKLSEFKKKPL